MNPFVRFEKWYNEELSLSNVTIPSACCLSTIGLDGYPNARFISFKTIVDEAFIFSGPLNSRKGLEIQQNSKSALTFWWTETERQVRIQGDASLLGEHLFDDYFKSRNTESKIISRISNQGKVLADKDEFLKLFNEEIEKFKDQEIPRPDDWGVFKLLPIRIEFLEFEESRMHSRELFTKKDGDWSSEFLQP